MQTRIKEHVFKIFNSKATSRGDVRRIRTYGEHRLDADNAGIGGFDTCLSHRVLLVLLRESLQGMAPLPF